MNLIHIQFERKDLYLIFEDFISKITNELNMNQQMELNKITFNLVEEFITFTNIENEMIIDSNQELKEEIELILSEFEISKVDLFSLPPKKIEEKIDEAIKNKENKFNLSIFVDKEYDTLFNVLFATNIIEYPETETEGGESYIDYQDFEYPEYFDIIDAVIMDEKYKDYEIKFDHTGGDEEHLDFYYSIQRKYITYEEIETLKGKTSQEIEDITIDGAYPILNLQDDTYIVVGWIDLEGNLEMFDNYKKPIIVTIDMLIFDEDRQYYLLFKEDIKKGSISSKSNIYKIIPEIKREEKIEDKLNQCFQLGLQISYFGLGLIRSSLKSIEKDPNDLSLYKLLKEYMEQFGKDLDKGIEYKCITSDIKGIFEELKNKINLKSFKEAGIILYSISSKLREKYIPFQRRILIFNSSIK